MHLESCSGLWEEPLECTKLFSLSAQVGLTFSCPDFSHFPYVRFVAVSQRLELLIANSLEEWELYSRSLFRIYQHDFNITERLTVYLVFSRGNHRHLEILSLNATTSNSGIRIPPFWLLAQSLQYYKVVISSPWCQGWRPWGFSSKRISVLSWRVT